MSKITGNEPVYSAISQSDQHSFYEPGIPVRLHIAAMLFQGMLAQNIMAENIRDAINQGKVKNAERAYAVMALEDADALIAAYNSTPNPNAVVQ
jgi:hypothetical protein